MFEDHPENSKAAKKAAAAAKAKDSSLAEVQDQVDAEQEQGFRGIEVDCTPNENYTVAGVIAGLPTPETDKDHAKAVREHLVDVETQVEGVAAKN